VIGGMAGGLGNEAVRGERMNVIKRKTTLRALFLILMLSLIAVITVACEGPAPIKIVNQTDQLLTIYITDQRVGEVSPGTEIKNQNRLISISGIKIYPIIAKNSKGDVVYSSSFTRDQLSRDMDWIIVILPLNK
jgi:hypothetical protein